MFADFGVNRSPSQQVSLSGERRQFQRTAYLAMSRPGRKNPVAFCPEHVTDEQDIVAMNEPIEIRRRPHREIGIKFLAENGPLQMREDFVLF